MIDILQELNLEISEYKKKYNSFEFNDISRFAINLLKTYPDIRDSLKYHFKEIMIDEYQDTNDIQEAFISLIENNNVYMVEILNNLFIASVMPIQVYSKINMINTKKEKWI